MLFAMFYIFSLVTMGFEIGRFEGEVEVDEELICPICRGVLEDPLQVSSSHE